MKTIYLLQCVKKWYRMDQKDLHLVFIDQKEGVGLKI